MNYTEHAPAENALTSQDDAGNEKSLSRRDFNKLLGTGAAAALALPLIKTLSGKVTRAVDRAPAASTGQPIKIYFESDEQAGWKPIVSAYNTGSSGSLGQASLEPVSSTTYETIMPRTLSAGTAADIIEVGPGNGEPVSVDILVPGGYLLDLSNEPWASQLPPKIKDVCSVNGKLYMLPEKGSGQLVYYNKKIFHQLDLAVPQTFPALLATCAKLKAEGHYPIWLDASAGFVGGLWPIFLLFPLAADQDVADPNWPALRAAGKVSFLHSGWKTALTRFMTLFNAGYFTPDPTGGASLELITDGKAAMIPAYPEGFSIYGPPLFGKNNAGVMALPQTNSASTLTAIAGAGYGLAVNAKSPNAAAAKAFLNTAAQPANVTEFVHTIGGIPLLPANTGAIDPAFTEWVALVRRRAVPMFDQKWPNAFVIKSLEQGAAGLITGSTNINLVLESMDNAWDEGYI